MVKAPPIGETLWQSYGNSCNNSCGDTVSNSYSYGKSCGNICGSYYANSCSGDTATSNGVSNSEGDSDGSRIVTNSDGDAGKVANSTESAMGADVDAEEKDVQEAGFNSEGYLEQLHFAQRAVDNSRRCLVAIKFNTSTVMACVQRNSSLFDHEASLSSFRGGERLIN